MTIYRESRESTWDALESRDDPGWWQPALMYRPIGSIGETPLRMTISFATRGQCLAWIETEIVGVRMSDALARP